MGLWIGVNTGPLKTCSLAEQMRSLTKYPHLGSVYCTDHLFEAHLACRHTCWSPGWWASRILKYKLTFINTPYYTQLEIITDVLAKSRKIFVRVGNIAQQMVEV